MGAHTAPWVTDLGSMYSTEFYDEYASERPHHTVLAQPQIKNSIKYTCSNWKRTDRKKLMKTPRVRIISSEISPPRNDRNLVLLAINFYTKFVDSSSKYKKQNNTKLVDSSSSTNPRDL